MCKCWLYCFTVEYISNIWISFSSFFYLTFQFLHLRHHSKVVRTINRQFA
nr:MAG TPA: hypothetical protein [Caudoviricetes sp.]